MKKTLLTIFVIISSIAILALSIRGIAGNPTSADVNDPKWKDEGPFELSPERGRFALALSLIEDGSFYFSVPIARFATPDLGFSNGRYVSLFAPLVSYIILPGYILGSQWDMGQVGTFAIISFFALMNLLLIRSIALRLGAHHAAAWFGSLMFLFATPAFAYGVSLYQHHISTFLILTCIHLLLAYESLWILPVIWFLAAASIPLDYPNAVMMVPIAYAALGKMMLIAKNSSGVSFTFRWPGVFTFLAAILPLAFFLWFNQMSYGNPLQLSGTVATVKEIDEQGSPVAPKNIGTEDTSSLTNPSKQEKVATGFFNTRSLLNGFYIHTISPDRGIIRFTPVILLGIAGAALLYSRNPGATALLSGVIGFNVILYSLWGDAWGGWAFGSRYLIPTYALLGIFAAYAVTIWRRQWYVLLFVFVLFIYSTGVNTLGALTSNRNPPEVEVLALEKLSGIIQKYTYERNYDMILANQSKSYVFQTHAHTSMTAWEYYLMIVTIITILAFICLLIVAM